MFLSLKLIKKEVERHAQKRDFVQKCAHYGSRTNHCQGMRAILNR